MSSWVVLQTLLETSFPRPRRLTISLLPHCDIVIMSCSADITGDKMSPSSTFNHQSSPSLWQCHHELFCRHYWRQAVPVLDVQPSVSSLIGIMSSWVVLQTLLEASCPHPQHGHQSHKSCRPDPHLSPVVWSCQTTPASLPCSETCHWLLGCGELHVCGGIHAGSAGKNLKNLSYEKDEILILLLSSEKDYNDLIKLSTFLSFHQFHLLIVTWAGYLLPPSELVPRVASGCDGTAWHSHTAAPRPPPAEGKDKEEGKQRAVNVGIIS